jgi:NAD(P)H-hydrate repair Nnr-like enzyme with NAD(P)H-hydrate epimerase domain
VESTCVAFSLQGSLAPLTDSRVFEVTSRKSLEANARRLYAGIFKRVESSGAPPSASRPLRAVVLLPGLGNNSQDYAAVGEALRNRGFHVETARVSRVDWLRNAAGLRQREYWTGNLQPRPVIDW